MALTTVTFNMWAYLRSLLDLHLVTIGQNIGVSGDPNTAGPITVDFPSGSPIGVGQAGTGSTFINTSTGATYVNVGTLASPVWVLQGLALAPTTTQWYGLRAGSIPTGSTGAPGVYQPFGMSNVSIAGAADGDTDQADGTYLRFSTAASGGSQAGFQSNREGPQVRHNPQLQVNIRTDADITSIRFWVGLSTNQLANVDDIGGSSEYAMVRYSTVAVDPGFMAVTRNGVSQTVHGMITGVLSNTPYLIKITKVPGGGAWIFDINGVQLVTGDAGLSATAKLHCVVAGIFTQVASARRFLSSAVYGSYGT